MGRRLGGRIAALGVVVVLAGGCRPDRPSAAADAPNAAAAVSSDSARAVRAAVAALGSAVGSDRAYDVHAYRADSAGATVELYPRCPASPRVVCLGGGGVVRVEKSGAARVLDLYL